MLIHCFHQTHVTKSDERTHTTRSKARSGPNTSAHVAPMMIPREIVASLNRPVSHHFRVNDLKMFMTQSASVFKEVQSGFRSSSSSAINRILESSEMAM